MSKKELFTTTYSIILIVIMPIIIHLPIWFGIVDFYSGDASDLIPYFYGSKSLVYQTFQNSGEIALWNPHIMFGQPVVGNIQYALFYPLNIIFLLVPFFKALTYYQIIHLIVAGLGTYLLCQHTGSKKAGSTIASLLMILNGRIIYYINAGWLSYFSSICWLPLFIFLSLKTLKQKSLYYPIFLSIIFGMSFLSGTPQYAFLGFYLFIISGLFQLFHEKSKNNRIHLIYRIFLTGFISFLLIGIQLFPAMEQTYLSTRLVIENHSIGFYFQWDLKQWIRILFRPELLRHDFTWELCAYIGIGGIILSFFGLISSVRNLKLIFIWGIIPWLLSMGPEVPILSSLASHTPGISMLTNPSRYFIFTIIILALLSGHGLDYLISTKLKKRRLLYLLAVMTLGLITLGLIIKPYEQGSDNISIRYFSTIIIFFILFACYIWKRSRILQYIILIWLIIDPLYLSMDILLKEKYHIKDLEPPLRIINAIKNSTKHPRIASIQSKDAWNNNLLTPFDDWICITNNIDRASGYEPLGMRKAHSFAAKMDGTGSLIKNLWGYRLWSFHNHRLFNVAGITHLITTELISDPRLKPITNELITMPHFHGGWWEAKRLYLYENIHAYPRAFLMDNHLNITPIELNILSPNKRQLIFQTDIPQLLIMSESFHPGWIIKNQDADLKLEPFLGYFISLRIPPGKYNIQLEFKPKSFLIGSLFSIIGIIIIISYILYQYTLNKKIDLPTDYRPQYQIYIL